MTKGIIAAVMAVIMMFTSTSCKNNAPTEHIISSTEAAKSVGMGLNLGNTMEAYNASGCEKITYEWTPEVGENRRPAPQRTASSVQPV